MSSHFSKNQDFNANMSLISPSLLQNLDGTVIMIESKREGHQGRYIDGRRRKARVNAVNETELVTNVSNKWTLHYIGGDTGDIVVLESLLQRGHYLDMNDEKHWDRHVLKVTSHSNLPSGRGEEWAQFRVRGSSLDDVAFQSCRPQWDNRWLDSHEDGRLYGSLNSNQVNNPTFENKEDWARFKICFSAEVIDEYVFTSGTTFNTTENPIVKTFSHTTGITRTDGQTYEHNAKLVLEIIKNFGVASFTSSSVKFGGNHSQEWATVTEEFQDSEAVTEEVRLTVLPGEMVTVYQLQGTYGQFRVHYPDYVVIHPKEIRELSRL